MQEPLISILVPCLNQASFIDDCLASIASQTYSNWQCNICDGGSTDGSLARIEAFQNQCSNTSIHHRKPNGIYDAINYLIQNAHGEFLVILPADDYLDPNFLKRLAKKLMEDQEIAFAYGALQVIGENSETTNKWWKQSSPFSFAQERANNLEEGGSEYDLFLLHACGYSVFVSLTQILFRRTCFDRIGLFKTDIGSAADFHWLCVACYQLAASYDSETWGGWRLHSNQATARSELEIKDPIRHRLKLFALACHDLAKEFPAMSEQLIRLVLYSKVDYAIRTLFNASRGPLHRSRGLFECLAHPIVTRTLLNARSRHAVGLTQPILGIYPVEGLTFTGQHRSDL